MNTQQTLELYSIKDLKTQKFFPPFFASNRDEACRLMREQVNYKSSLISSFPEDYELYFLGSFEDFTGEIDTENPQFICGLNSLKQDDTLKYDELLSNTKNLQAQIDSSVLRFNSAMNDFKSTFDVFLKNCESRFESLTHVVHVEDKVNKTSFLEKLFTH